MTAVPFADMGIEEVDARLRMIYEGSPDPKPRREGAFDAVNQAAMVALNRGFGDPSYGGGLSGEAAPYFLGIDAGDSMEPVTLLMRAEPDGSFTVVDERRGSDA